MPVHLTRRRGEIWYAKGTVRVGQTAVQVGEFSTGCSARNTAASVAAAKDTEVRQTILDGPAGRTQRMTIADCITAYASRPGGLRAADAARINDFNERIGHLPLADAAHAWGFWLRTRGARMAAASAARWQAILRAAVRHGAIANQAPIPTIPTVRQPSTDRVAYLTEAEARRLLASYNPWAACPVLLLAYQGLRTQEALQLDWRAVDLARRTLYVAGDEAKTGRGRTLPLHPRVDALLFGLWAAAGRPGGGPVFLSARGRPYADTRGQGGNPLTQAHITACRLAGISGFRVHDWRHHWASHMVMTGCDMHTLMRLGGWSTPRMVQRYAAVSIDHMAEAIGRLR